MTKPDTIDFVVYKDDRKLDFEGVDAHFCKTDISQPKPHLLNAL